MIDCALRELNGQILRTFEVVDAEDGTGGAQVHSNW